MFDLEKRTLIQGGNELPIVRWEVWFLTPKGLANVLGDAIDVCQSIDMDPAACIVPVPVAIDNAGRYEVIMRQT